MHAATPAGISPAMLSISDACKYAGCGQTKLRELIREGQLAACKLGRRTLVSKNSLDELLANLPRKE